MSVISKAAMFNDAQRSGMLLTRVLRATAWFVQMKGDIA